MKNTQTKSRHCQRKCFTQFICGFVLAGFLSGCAHTAQKTILPQLFSAPAVPATTSSDAILTHINRSAAMLTSLSAAGTLEIKQYAIQRISRCSCLLMILGRDKLLLQGYQPLIPNYFTFIINRNSFWYYIPSHNRIFTGNADSLTHPAEYEFAFTPPLMRAALLPPLFPESSAEARIVSTGYVIREKENLTGLFAKRIEGSFTAAVPRRMTLLHADGTTAALVSTSDYSTDGAAQYPKKITIENPATNTAIVFTFHTVRMNGELDEKIFRLEKPSGVIIEEIT